MGGAVLFFLAGQISSVSNHSFGTFLVDDSNRQAFDAAQAVAELRRTDPAPLLLLGDSGCGKTHLLRAVVGRVRAATKHIGLAFITARHFPDAARLLIDDPSPVERAAGAILLVDQLEEFVDLVDELEVVTRIFLDNGHAVVFASSLHPGRLQSLTPGLQEILGGAQTVAIAPQSAETRVQLLKRQFREESSDVIRRQSLEIEALRREVDRLRGSGGSGEGHEHLALERAHSGELDKRVAALQAENDHLSAELKAVRAREGETLRLEEELHRARNEAGSLRGQVEGLGSAVAELETLRAKLETLEQSQARLREQTAENEALQREVRTLQDQLRDAWARSAHVAELDDEIASLRTGLADAQAAASDRDNLARECASLRNALAEAQSESQHARDEANTLLARAESLLELVESNRARFREVEAQRTAQIAELQQQLEHEREQAVPLEDLLAVKRQAESALAQLGTERQSFEETQRSLENACAEALSRADALEGETARLRADLEARGAELKDAREVRDAARRELEEVRPANAHLKEENSDLRREVLEVNSRREETQQALYDMEAQRDEAVAEVKSLRGALEAMQHEADERRAQYRQLEERLDGLRAEHDGLQGLFAAKARELGALAAALNAMADAPGAGAEAGADQDEPTSGGDSAEDAIAFVAVEPSAGDKLDSGEPNEGDAEEPHEVGVETAPSKIEGDRQEDDDDDDHDEFVTDSGDEVLPEALFDDDDHGSWVTARFPHTPAGNGAHAVGQPNGHHADTAGDPPADAPAAPEPLEPLKELSPLDDERDASI